MCSIRPLISLTFLSFACAQFSLGGINTAQDLSSTCPAEFAQLSPCVDSSEALSECITCVTEYVLAAETTAMNVTVSTTKSGESTLEGGDEAPTLVPYTCEDVKQDVCTAISSCGDVCGLVNRTTVLTFGRDCEDLFLKMAGCYLGDQGSMAMTELKCALDGTCAEEEAGDGDENNREASNEEKNDGDRDGVVARHRYSMLNLVTAFAAVILSL